MVVEENGFDGCGAFGIDSENVVERGGGVEETTCDGLGEDFVNLFDGVG